MAMSVNAIRTVTIQARTEGVDQAAASVQNLANAQTNLAVVSDTTTKRSLSAEQAFRRQTLAYVDGAREAARFAKETRTLDAAMAQGMLGDPSTAAAQSAYFQRLELIRQKTVGTSAANDNLGKSTGLAAHQMQNLGFQMNDVVSGLAMGQSPFTIMAQQGGQVYQILSMSEGGVGGAVRALGGQLAGLVTPWRVLAVGATAAATAVSLFYSSQFKDAPTAEQNLEEHARLLGVIKKMYEETSAAAADFARRDQVAVIFQQTQNLERLRNDMQALIQQATSRVSAPVITGPAEMGGFGLPTVDKVNEEFAAFQGAVERLRASMAAGSPNVQAFRTEIAEIATAAGATNPHIKQMGDELLFQSNSWLDYASKIAVAVAQLAVLSGTATEAQRALAGLGKSIDFDKVYSDALDKLIQMAPKANESIIQQNKLNDALRKKNEAIAALNQTDAGAAEFTAKKAGIEQAYQRAVQATTNTQKESVSSYDTLLQRTRDRIEELQLEAQYASKTAEEVVKLKTMHDLERAAKASNITVTEAMRQEWAKLAQDTATATSAVERSRESMRQMKEMQNQIADMGSDLFSAWLDGADSFDNALKNLSKRFRDMAVDALLFGKGPFAGALGFGATQSGQQGGLFGAMMGNDVSFFKTLTSATARGSEKGITEGWENILSGALAQKSSPGGPGGVGNLGRGAAGALAFYGAYAGATPDTTQSAISGGLSGAVGGAMLAPMLGAGLGPAGMLVGAALGAGLGLFGSNSARREQERAQQQQAREGWDSMRSDFVRFATALQGKGQGTLASALDEARAGADKFRESARKAGDVLSVIQLDQALAQFEARKFDEFRRSFADLMEAFNEGLGPNSPIVQGRNAVRQALETAKGFIEDVKTSVGVNDKVTTGPSLSGFMEQMGPALLNPGMVGSMFMFSMQEALNPQNLITPEQTAAIDQARAAAVNYLAALLDGARVMSATEQEFETLVGKASELKSAIAELGLSAEQAASVVDGRFNNALRKMVERFDLQVGAEIHELEGKGWINEIGSLIEKFQQRMADAALIGGNVDWIQRWFKLATQKVVDEAEMSAQALEELYAHFPQLRGELESFAETVRLSAAEWEQINQGMRDRLFAATNDSSTPDGARAAIDRQQALERERVQLEGWTQEQLVWLAEVHAAERLKVEQDLQDRLAQRARSYADRLFAVINDDSTLNGALASLQRKQQQEIEEELKLGGEQLVLLEQAQLAERQKLIRDFNDRAIEEEQRRADEQKRILEEAQNFLAAFSRRIREYIDGLKASADSPLSPQARLNAAQTAFNSQRTLAQSGNRDALNGITQYASSLLDAAKDYFASSSGFQSIFNTVVSQLEALPSQVSAEQLIVDAINTASTANTSVTNSSANVVKAEIAAMQVALQSVMNTGNPQAIASALSVYFNKIDANTDQSISFQEMKDALGASYSQGTLKSVFDSLAGTDGVIKKAELIKAATESTKTATEGTKTAMGASGTNGTLIYHVVKTAEELVSIHALTRDTIGVTLETISQKLSSIERHTSNTVGALTAETSGALAMLSSINGYASRMTAHLEAYLQPIRENSRRTVDNLWHQNAKDGIGRENGVATGAIIRGPGTGTSDSIGPLWLSNGEGVLNAAAVAGIGDAAVHYMNQHHRLPKMPSFAFAANDNGHQAVVAELRRSNDALLRRIDLLERRLIQAEVAAAEHVAEPMERMADATRDISRRARRDEARRA